MSLVELFLEDDETSELTTQDEYKICQMRFFKTFFVIFVVSWEVLWRFNYGKEKLYHCSDGWQTLVIYWQIHFPAGLY